MFRFDKWACFVYVIAGARRLHVSFIIKAIACCSIQTSVTCTILVNWLVVMVSGFQLTNAVTVKFVVDCDRRG